VVAQRVLDAAGQFAGYNVVKIREPKQQRKVVERALLDIERKRIDVGKRELDLYVANLPGSMNPPSSDHRVKGALSDWPMHFSCLKRLVEQSAEWLKTVQAQLQEALLHTLGVSPGLPVACALRILG
jgi:hypothetical protein